MPSRLPSAKVLNDTHLQRPGHHVSLLAVGKPDNTVLCIPLFTRFNFRFLTRLFPICESAPSWMFYLLCLIIKIAVCGKVSSTISSRSWEASQFPDHPKSLTKCLWGKSPRTSQQSLGKLTLASSQVFRYRKGTQHEKVLPQWKTATTWCFVVRRGKNDSVQFCYGFCSD